MSSWKVFRCRDEERVDSLWQRKGHEKEKKRSEKVEWIVYFLGNELENSFSGVQPSQSQADWTSSECLNIEGSWTGEELSFDSETSADHDQHSPLESPEDRSEFK